jgi:hypothetical protein
MERLPTTEPPKSSLADLIASSALFGELSPDDAAALA